MALGDGAKEVGELVAVRVRRSLSAVADNDGVVVFGNAGDGLDRVGTGRAEDADHARVLVVADEVDERLHDHVGLAAAVEDVQLQLEVAQEVGVVVDGVDGHPGGCTFRHRCKYPI